MSQGWATWGWQAMRQFSPADPEAQPSNIRIADPTIRDMSAVSFFRQVSPADRLSWFRKGLVQSIRIPSICYLRTKLQLSI